MRPVLQSVAFLLLTACPSTPSVCITVVANEPFIVGVDDEPVAWNRDGEPVDLCVTEDEHVEVFVIPPQ
ncbi:MAG: hypothetical protein EPN91_10785 [Salinibacterium sp.]|nr:MAG: hypothetical protein EPN91_10785 [Salinibacterium sp.]